MPTKSLNRPESLFVRHLEKQKVVGHSYGRSKFGGKEKIKIRRCFASAEEAMRWMRKFLSEHPEYRHRRKFLKNVLRGIRIRPRFYQGGAPGLVQQH